MIDAKKFGEKILRDKYYDFENKIRTFVGDIEELDRFLGSNGFKKDTVPFMQEICKSALVLFPTLKELSLFVRELNIQEEQEDKKKEEFYKNLNNLVKAAKKQKGK